MCNTMVNNRLCKVPTKNEYCHIHIKMMSAANLSELARLKEQLRCQEATLSAKISNQSKELAIINTRLSDALRKLQIIEYSDYIKYALTPISINRSFKAAIRDPANAETIKAIFNADINQCENIYDELLTKRNMITHKYTHQTWTKKKKPPLHGKSVKKLISSIKTYDLLRDKKTLIRIQ